MSATLTSEPRIESNVDSEAGVDQSTTGNELDTGASQETGQETSGENLQNASIGSSSNLRETRIRAQRNAQEEKEPGDSGLTRAGRALGQKAQNEREKGAKVRQDALENIGKGLSKIGGVFASIGRGVKSAVGGTFDWGLGVGVDTFGALANGKVWGTGIAGGAAIGTAVVLSGAVTIPAIIGVSVATAVGGAAAMKAGQGIYLGFKSLYEKAKETYEMCSKVIEYGLKEYRAKKNEETKSEDLKSTIDKANDIQDESISEKALKGVQNANDKINDFVAKRFEQDTDKLKKGESKALEDLHKGSVEINEEIVKGYKAISQHKSKIGNKKAENQALKDLTISDFETKTVGNSERYFDAALDLASKGLLDTISEDTDGFKALEIASEYKLAVDVAEDVAVVASQVYSDIVENATSFDDFRVRMAHANAFKRKLLESFEAAIGTGQYNFVELLEGLSQVPTNKYDVEADIKKLDELKRKK